MAKRKQKQKFPPIKAEEKQQVAHRLNLGHDFGVKQDEYGRNRLVKDTAESKRRYERGSKSGIIRISNTDPLKGLRLTDPQRQAAERFQDAYDMAEREGMKAASFNERVDGGKIGQNVPAHILDALDSLRQAREELLPQEMVVVEAVCGRRLSVKQAAEEMKKTRDIAKDRLENALERLAMCYGILRAQARRDAPTVHFENEQWRVTSEGMETIPGKTPFHVVFEGNNLFALDATGSVYLWPIEMTERAWVDVEEFIQAFLHAVDVHAATPVDGDMLVESLRVARLIRTAAHAARAASGER